MRLRSAVVVVLAGVSLVQCKTPGEAPAAEVAAAGSTLDMSLSRKKAVTTVELTGHASKIKGDLPMWVKVRDMDDERYCKQMATDAVLRKERAALHATTYLFKNCEIQATDGWLSSCKMEVTCSDPIVEYSDDNYEYRAVSFIGGKHISKVEDVVFEGGAPDWMTYCHEEFNPSTVDGNNVEDMTGDFVSNSTIFFGKLTSGTAVQGCRYWRYWKK